MPGRQADDINIDIPFSEYRFEKIVDELKIIINDNFEGVKLTGMLNKLEAGATMKKIQYDFFEKLPVGNSNFTQRIVDACEPFTNFKTVIEDGKAVKKIGFAIIVKNSDWDTYPKMPLKR